LDKFVFKNARHLLDLIERIYSADDLYSLAKLFFLSLQKILPFHSAGLWLIDGETWEMVDVLGYKCGTNVLVQHKKNTTPYSVSFQSIQWPTHQNKATIFSADKAPSHNYRGGVYYNYHSLSIISGINDKPVSVINLYRKTPDNSFTNEDAILLNRVAPHVAQAITLDLGLSEDDPYLASGLLVYSSDGELLYRNQRSRELVPDYPPEELLAMARQPNCAKRPNVGCHLHVFTPQPNSLLYWMSNRDVAYGSGKQLVNKHYNTVVVAQPFLLRNIIEKRLRQSRLSPREFDVALVTIQGLSNAEIAAHLCIDETTVKDHLQRIYSKLSVRSRTAMVSRVLNLDKELAGLTGQRNKTCQRNH
jgi:DNA-binding CsgD family transcriptional regulator